MYILVKTVPFVKLKTLDYISRVAKKETNFSLTFHMLIHTYVTMLIEQWREPKRDTEKIRAYIRITLDTYEHSSEDSQRNAIDVYEMYIK